MTPYTRLAVVCAAAAIAWPCLATAQTGSSLQAAHDPSYDHAASCVAAMKPRATELADRYLDGDDSVHPELIRMTEASLAIVDLAIKSGLTKAESDVLLASAEEFQQSVPPAKLARLVSACLAEGAALLSAAEPVDREVLKQAARQRIEQLRAGVRNGVAR
jgi:hypothetical protein